MAVRVLRSAFIFDILESSSPSRFVTKSMVLPNTLLGFLLKSTGVASTGSISLMGVCALGVS